MAGNLVTFGVGKYHLIEERSDLLSHVFERVKNHIKEKQIRLD